MAIDNQAAADAFFNAMRDYLGWEPTPENETHFRGAWRAGFNAFLVYIKANAEVVPNTFAAQTAIPVQVDTVTGIGATTAPGPLEGVGQIT